MNSLIEYFAWLEHNFAAKSTRLNHHQVFKPKGTLKSGDKYKTKIELASEIITELIESGFNIELVLADSLYGESSQFIQKLTEYQLNYVVAISL